MVSSFGIILLFGITAVAFLMAIFVISGLLRSQKPNEEKLSTYECGEESIGEISLHTFNARYYIVAILFLLFDVEVILLFPWTKLFLAGKIAISDLQLLIELLIFIFVLAIGLVYVWKKGHLDWNSAPQLLKNSEIPEIYKHFNASQTK